MGATLLLCRYLPRQLVWEWIAAAFLRLYLLEKVCRLTYQLLQYCCPKVHGIKSVIGVRPLFFSKYIWCSFSQCTSVSVRHYVSMHMSLYYVLMYPRVCSTAFLVCIMFGIDQMDAVLAACSCQKKVELEFVCSVHAWMKFSHVEFVLNSCNWLASKYSFVLSFVRVFVEWGVLAGDALHFKVLTFSLYEKDCT